MAIVALAVALSATATPATAAKAPKLEVSAVSTRSIDLRWRGAERKARWSLRYRREGGAWSRSVTRGTQRARLRGLKRGTVYEAAVARCGRRGCRPWSNRVRTATLLAPFSGPHPDPGCATFPATDEFNRNISAAPVAADSGSIIARINADGGDFLHPDFGSDPTYGIPWVVVPAAQPAVPIRFGAYGDESDPGPYPVPPGAPIEGGRRSSGDRHVLVVRRPSAPGGPCSLFELYRAREGVGPRSGWNAESGAVFDLGSPLAGQRPRGWTSADAAGLPIYPGLVTYRKSQAARSNMPSGSRSSGPAGAMSPPPPITHPTRAAPTGRRWACACGSPPPTTSRN